MNIVYLVFNIDKLLLNNFVVCYVLVLLINNQCLMQLIYYGMVEIVVFILLRVLWVYDNDVKIMEYNLEKLCEQLKVLGIENFMLYFWVLISFQVWNLSLLKMVEFIQVDMVQVGVKVVIVLVEGCFQEVCLMDMNYDLILFGWVMDSNDLDSFFRLLLSCVVINL